MVALADRLYEGIPLLRWASILPPMPDISFPRRVTAWHRGSATAKKFRMENWSRQVRGDRWLWKPSELLPTWHLCSLCDRIGPSFILRCNGLDFYQEDARSTRVALRLIIGDTNATDPLLSDEEPDTAWATIGEKVVLAAASACESVRPGSRGKRFFSDADSGHWRARRRRAA
jgi:hypothetical protein